MKQYFTFSAIKLKLVSFGKKILKHWHLLAVFLLAAIFFVSVSGFNYLTQSDGFVKWASPDETANYNISKLYGQTGDMSVYESYNLIVGDIMHPRSFRCDHGYIKPVSFLGIILIYGSIVSVLGYEVLPYLTPAFAAIGLLFYYLLIRRLFGKQNALLSAFFLAAFPVYIYYSARSMFHNVLFIVLTLGGTYFAVLFGQLKSKSKEKFLSFSRQAFNWRKFVYPALSGSMFGLAIATRTSELIWLGPFLAILYVLNAYRLGLVKPLIFSAFLLFALIPSMQWNIMLYGSPYSTGYPEMNQSISEITQSGTALVKTTIGGAAQSENPAKKIFNNLFHFGFHPQKSLTMFKYYFVYMFYWLFIPAVLGGIIFLQRWSGWKMKHLAFFLSFLTFSGILVLYYGSWEFYDNPNPKSFTIGNSYTRYWLPMYLGAIPLASLFWIRFTRALYPFNFPALNNSKNRLVEKFKKIRLRLFSGGLLAIAVAAIMIMSVNYVLFGSEEGLYYSILRNKTTRYEFDKVLELTESNSVIITRYHDKLFFPERKVIVGLFDDPNMIKKYAGLVDILPVYYYNFNFPEKDFAYLNNSRLAAEDLQIKVVSRVTGDFTLYKLEKRAEVVEENN